MNNDLSHCSYHGCIYDSDCQTYDKHRICKTENKICECDTDYKEDSSSLKCTHSPSNISSTDKYKMIFMFICVLNLIGFIVLWFHCIQKKRYDALLSQANNLT
jgi:hypothetical protein